MSYVAERYSNSLENDGGEYDHGAQTSRPDLHVVVNNYGDVSTTQGVLSELANPDANELAAADEIVIDDQASKQALEEAIKSTTDPASMETLQLYLRNIGRTKLLTAQQETSLAKRIKAGDPQARNQMIEANLRLVVSISKKYLGTHVDFLDLIQDGNLGLMKAVEMFDHRKGYRFSTYGKWWIRNALDKALADKSHNIRIPVDVFEDLKKVNRARYNLQARLERDPTSQEIATEANLPPSRVADILSLPTSNISLSKPIGDAEEAEFGDFLPDNSATMPYQAANDSFNRKMLASGLASLPFVERLVIEMRFGLGTFTIPYTLKEIGDYFGVTRERIRQIEAQALKTLEADEDAQRMIGATEMFGEVELALAPEGYVGPSGLALSAIKRQSADRRMRVHIREDNVLSGLSADQITDVLTQLSIKGDTRQIITRRHGLGGKTQLTLDEIAFLHAKKSNTISKKANYVYNRVRALEQPTRPPLQSEPEISLGERLANLAEEESRQADQFRGNRNARGNRKDALNGLTASQVSDIIDYLQIQGKDREFLVLRHGMDGQPEHTVDRARKAIGISTTRLTKLRKGLNMALKPIEVR